jgi:hypothetical protein
MTKIHCDFCDSTPAHTFQEVDICLDCLFNALLIYTAKDYKRAVDIFNCLPVKLINGQFRADKQKGL